VKAGSNKNVDASADLNGPPGVNPGLKKLFTVRATVGVEKKAAVPGAITFQLNVLPVGAMVEDATPGGKPPAQATPPQGITVAAVVFENVLVVVLAPKPKSPVPENAEA